MLTSPRVVMALALSFAALCLVGWLSMNGTNLLTWDGMKQAVHRLTSNESPEDDLPYITRRPMMPGGKSLAVEPDDLTGIDELPRLSLQSHDEPDSADDTEWATRR